MPIQPPRSGYHHNHYVPEWYQRRFLAPQSTEAKFHYLDLAPPLIAGPNGHSWNKKPLNRWGPKRCFAEDDLYTTKFGAFESTEIEERFFGKIDSDGARAVEYFSTFQHPSADGEAFRDILDYMGVQKLRTPKGLANFSKMIGNQDKNIALLAMQKLLRLHNAIWSECVWQVCSAESSKVKFILNDHPVTVYNREIFPLSAYCRKFDDPDIRMTGTQTLFPLSMDKILVLTNLSWVRNPYESARKIRPNPALLRPAMFNFMQIQTGRLLSAIEVSEINFILKRRALRFVAAAEEEWLYPERSIPTENWGRLGEGLLLMPDPRGVTFGNQIVVGYEGGHSDVFDEYGRRPGQQDYQDKKRHDKEWKTFHRFQGEFARRFGPHRRGMSYEFGRLDADDSAEFHQHMLRQESYYGGRKGDRPARRSQRAFRR